MEQQKRYLVLDTNILLSDANNLRQLSEPGTVIVLPETVLDELDSKKSVIGDIGYQAREVGRLLTQATRRGTTQLEDLTINILVLEDQIIHVVSSSLYPSYSDTSSSIINDRKIIEIAYQYWNIHSDDLIVFVTNDIMAALRAESLGLQTQSLKLVESLDLQFTKELTISNDVFPILYRSSIIDIDPGYQPENFNYVFTNELTGEPKLATINHNGSVSIISKDTEKELRSGYINPLNSGHLFLTKALRDTSIPIVIVDSAAGTGKTVTTLASAMRCVDLGHYDGIVYIRASVNDVPREEEVGFLSGNEEKFAVYLHPLHDSIEFIARNQFKDSKLKGAAFEEFIQTKQEEIVKKYNIEGMIGLGLRGRTFHNKFIIIDEPQNQSPASLQKMLTRLGKNCKVAIVGSNRQIDNPYETKYTNGLSVLLNACRIRQSIPLHAVTLTKIVRSDIAEFAENLFSKEPS